MTNMDAMTNIEARLFINGEFVHSSDHRTFEIISPSTRELVAQVEEASIADTNAAVAAAKAAQPAWAAQPIHERAKPMKKLATLIRANAQEISYLEAISMGRPVAGYTDAFICAGFFDYYAEAAWEAQGSSSLNTPETVAMTLRQPFGVAAGIIPWNVATTFFGMKVAPAIVAGNGMVLKTSEKAPLTCAFIATLIQQAGFPPGIINIIHGHGTVSGATLASHMDVGVLSFTGSSRTGRLIMEASAKSNLKVVHLELGGKSPAIVFDDADMEQAAKETQFSVTWNSGQVCMANTRIYVQDTCAERFIAAFKENYSRVKVGSPTEPTTDIGPVADQSQFENVKRYIDLAKEAGTCVLGGEHEDVGKGYYIKPHIFTNLPDDSTPMREEIFGPVVAINVFKTEEEAVRRANDSEFGLYASLFTKDISRAMRVAKALDSGMVGVNCTSPTVAPDLLMGGYKGSGIGREGLKQSLLNFLEEKCVVIKI
ncbi:putative aldehyde dehydrogenase protein [Neofusicoccum parvum]|nr:putative aldehyde dehydrogenase protein [Neofusicoccum parvum]